MNVPVVRPWAVRGLKEQPPSGVTLHACDLDSDTDLPLAEAMARLTADEAARAARMPLSRERQRFQRARGFLRGVLAAELGCAPRDVPLAEGLNGKPCLAAPVAAGSPDFNLSHSGGLAVLAISRIGAVGIDVERPERPFDPMDLAASVFCPEELSTLRSLPEAERMDRFLIYWMAKEARMKLTGEGLSLEPRSIALGLSDGMPQSVSAPVWPAVDIHVLRVPGRLAICALATARGAADMQEPRRWA